MASFLKPARPRTHRKEPTPATLEPSIAGTQSQDDAREMPAAPRAGQRAEAPQAAGTRASLRPLRRSTNNYQAPSTCHTVKQDRQDPGLTKLPCRLEEPGDHKEIKE